MFGIRKSVWLVIAISLLTSACQPGSYSQSATGQDNPGEPMINPESWPLQQPVMVRDAGTEQRIADLVAKMTLEEKVGQIMQADIDDVSPQQVREFKLGSILNGGGSAPDKNLRNTPDSWLALADEFWEASTDTSDGGVGIPVIWGTDAVHGHSNVVGATLFPHNIGLGAANDPDLVYEIGRVTALEILTTGLDWTFAPTIAVVRNDRWGRTYEGYSEDPRIVTAYAPRIIEGIQGVYGSDEFLGEDHIIATAKHFTGDGGTRDGIDQGDNQSTEAELREIHTAAYYPAIAAGAQSVMASYNSFHGKKMHGIKSMLSDVLVGRMGFDGFVVGDWNGHGQVRGCENESCAASFNAGLDMFMVPDDWEDLYNNTLKQVKTGKITQQRLDQAVARILRVKIRAGVLDAPRPSYRKNAGNWALLAAPEHRAIARDAVRKSLVLLKNENSTLPLTANSRVLVAGDGADNISKQSGGWTLSWQGTDNNNTHFPNGTSIYTGIRETVEAAGGQAFLSEDGDWTVKPDVAIVVFGEDPYAEGVGDRANVDFDSDEGIDLLKKFKKAGIPTVSIFISGRAMWVNPELNHSDAFVAAWLPGSEGGGIADVLFANTSGEPRFDFTGRLSYSWPANAQQVEVNVGDEDYKPLFPYGYGLGYTDNGSVALLSEDSRLADNSIDTSIQLVAHGKPVSPWSIVLKDVAGETRVTDVRGASPAGLLDILPADDKIQEDTFIANWSGSASLAIVGEATDFQQQANENYAMEMNYRVLEADVDKISLAMGQGAMSLKVKMSSTSTPDWQTARIGLSCFVNQGSQLEAIDEPLLIHAEGSLRLQVSSIKLTAAPGDEDCKNQEKPSDMLGRFDKSRDLFLPQFDVKTDVDDVHSAAAVGTMLADPRFSGVRYHAVAGAYGTQEGAYVPANELFEMVYDEHWSDAHTDRKKALREVSDIVADTLSHGGDVWIAEAGQSDFSASTVRLIKTRLPDIDTNSRIHIVQHSPWNQESTTAADLDYVKKHTDYHKIEDGNMTGNGTPGLNTESGAQWERATVDSRVGDYWKEARRIANEFNGKDGRYFNSSIGTGGLDFSDTAESCWLFGFSEIFDVEQFFDEFSPAKQD